MTLPGYDVLSVAISPQNLLIAKSFPLLPLFMERLNSAFLFHSLVKMKRNMTVCGSSCMILFLLVFIEIAELWRERE